MLGAGCMIGLEYIEVLSGVDPCNESGAARPMSGHGYCQLSSLDFAPFSIPLNMTCEGGELRPLL